MTASGPIAAALALVFAGGVTLAIQHLLLAGMVARGLAHVTALALNSIVGVLLLVAINGAWLGAPVVASTARSFQWWFVLPGVLGTFVVFALLVGYTRAGAAAPTVALIAGQVLAAVALDAFGQTASGQPLGIVGWAGIVLFVAGAALVLASRAG